MKKPNVIFILADDVGYGDTGVYGANSVQTPNIDKLAAQGMRFLDAHSASAICTPSRYSLLTGKYPHRKNLFAPITNNSPCLLEPDEPTLPKLFGSENYVTGLVGKWHLGFGSEEYPDWNTALQPGPIEAGFDSYFGLPVVAGFSPFVWVENHHVVGLDKSDPLRYGGTARTKHYREKFLDRNPMSGGSHAHSLFCDEKIGTVEASRARRWINSQANRDDGKPFFLMLASSLIHHPFTPGPKFKGKSGAGIYGDFLEELDWIVGEVVDAVDENDIANDTIIIFTSDNGGMLNIGGQEAIQSGHRINGDLLGFKFDCWEGGHRVPLIVRWPGEIEANTLSEQFVLLTDFYATFSAILAKQLEEDEAPDSYNLVPILFNQAKDPIRDEGLLAPHDPQNMALRSGDWLYVEAQGGGGFTAKNLGDHLMGGPSAFSFAGVQHSDYYDGDLVPGAPDVQLYNLRTDVGQRGNIAAEHPDIVKQLSEKLSALQSAQRTRP